MISIILLTCKTQGTPENKFLETQLIPAVMKKQKKEIKVNKIHRHHKVLNLHHNKKNQKINNL